MSASQHSSAHPTGEVDRDSARSVHKSETSATAGESSRSAAAKMDDVAFPLAADEVPEGGLAAWLTVAGAFLVQVCGFGYTGSFGVYQDFYKRVYLSNETSSSIAWIGSLNSFLLISTGLLAGRLFDRGYFYYQLYCGAILLSFSLFMLSLAKPDQYYQIILSQGIGAGLGEGLIYIPSVAIISQYFKKRRALTMTIVASGSSLGSIIHTIMLNNILNDPRLGFAIGARANAGMVAGLLLIACCLMRTRTPPQPHPAHLWASAKRFSKDGAYVFTAIGMSLFAIGFYFPLFYIQQDALTHGLDKTFSFYSLVILNGCSFIGRLAPGFFANKLGVQNILVTATFVCSVLIIGMISVASEASVIVISVIYGLFAGTYIAMLAPMLAHLTDDISELGARMGFAWTLSGLGTLIGTPIAGALLSKDYHWWRPALFSGIMAFVGWGCFVVSILLLHRRKTKQEPTEKA